MDLTLIYFLPSLMWLDFLSLIRYSKNCSLDSITKLKGLGKSFAVLIVGIIILSIGTMAYLLFAIGYFYFVSLNDIRIMLVSISLAYLFNWKINTNVLSPNTIFSSLRIRGLTRVLCHSRKQWHFSAAFILKRLPFIILFCLNYRPMFSRKYLQVSYHWIKDGIKQV